MPEYRHGKIERKWQDRWEREGTFTVANPGDPGFDATRPKYYVLIEFPYVSGEGLHVGHPRSYSALDVVARKRRMEGHNVLYPIGWDAFGLPTENFAIKTGQHPRLFTERNVGRFRGQLKRLGLSFDWSREVNTTDPAYYKWTQWIFIKLFEKGLAYKAEMPINWCESCKAGLANEEVVGGNCERCGSPVTRRVRSQWMLKITAHAERLLADLDTVDFLDKIKTQQANWIGRSTGAEIDFKIAGHEDKVMRVFTTRPDTLFGATYMVLSPEHRLVTELAGSCENLDEVRAYVEAAAQKSDFERTEVVKEVTGVEMKGVRAVNPANDTEIPVWIADYVLVSYGTGAIMAVPGHDERDWLFARKYGLPVVEVIAGGNVEEAAFTDIDTGTLVNSGFLNGMPAREAIRAMTEHLEDKGLGKASIQYKLRDWVFSRQHYWGEPIPLVQCSKCGWVPIPESELPLTLPEVERYQPTGTGDSPLALVKEWVNTTCPKCGGPAKRETDTMPQWAGSSWYFLRYCDPHNDKMLASPERLAYWTPVDWYNGGMEHTTLHLLYSRFWHKFLYDIGVVPTSEPYRKRTSHGLVLGETGEKMSKSRGNVVNPDEMVEKYGTDAFRLYEMFMGAFEQPTPWSTEGLKGMQRFLYRVWALQQKVSAGAPEDAETNRFVHRTIRQVGERIEAMKFNTAISALMTLANRFGSVEAVRREDFERFVLLLAPFAPHVAEELHELLGHKESLAYHPWPEYDEALCVDETIEIPIQINGKLRGRVTVPHDADEATVREAVNNNDRLAKKLVGKEIRKCIYVKNRLMNLIV